MDYTYYCFGLPGMPTAVYVAGAEHKRNTMILRYLTVMKNLFPDWVRQSARIAAKDTVYMIALAFMAVSAIMDLFTHFLIVEFE